MSDHPNVTHGYARRKGGKSTEYNTWMAMKARCERSGFIGWKYYGGRGIQVCERWQKFSNFIADIGPKPQGCSLDRIDTDGNYCPENCRWASKEQQCNNMTTNVKYTWNGKTQTRSQWARELGLSKDKLRRRIHVYGWSLEKSFTTPYTMWKK